MAQVDHTSLETDAGRQALTRRRLLQASLLGAGGLALAGCGTLEAGLAGAPVARGTVTYWDLFGGGDGARMQQMLEGFRKQYPRLELQHITLSWGNPYYTKLALATIGDQPPDVGVSHASRLPTLQGAGLLQELTPPALAKHGLTADKFNPKALRACTFNGKVFGLPLDTHPFVLFYNTDLCKKAGLLDAQGNLKSMDSPEAFTDALVRGKQASGQWGAVASINNDTATCWRLFQSFYSQLGGQMLEQEGTKVVLDDAKALQVLTFLKELSSTQKLMPQDVDYAGGIALFANGRSAFYLQGEWEITTFQLAKTPFSMTLFPNVFGGEGGYAVQADFHTLVVPAAGNDDARTDRALTLIRSLLDQSLTWAEGGHVPSWQPVADSPKYRQLKPQSNYAAAPDAAVIDPAGWYSGSGSNFEVISGSAVGSVLSGQAEPKAALQAMRSGLERYADTPSPI
jgi:multiple sugar transport system substrate-binding protein